MSKSNYSKQNKQRGGKPGKPYKGKKCSREDIKESKPMGASDDINDYRYYIDENSPLAEQLYSYSFNQFMGQSFDVGVNNLSNPVRTSVPTFMQIRLNPSAGWVDPTNPGASGINVAGMRTYTILTQGNGKNSAYGPEDVSILLLALGDILVRFGHGTRALGLMEQYNMRNRKYPNGAVQAAGFEFTSLQANFPIYRKQFNFLVNKFNQIPIPANIAYLDKCSKMYQGIYLDEEGSDLACTYMLVPNTYWLFDETYSATGSGLHTVVPTNQDTTYGWKWQPFADFLTDLDAAISAVLSSATFNTIFADILRLNVKQNWPLMRVSQVPDGYVVTPSKVEEISQWINNLVEFGDPMDAAAQTAAGLTLRTPDNDVVADVNTLCLKYTPSFYTGTTGTAPLIHYYPIVNFKSTNPTLEDRVNSVRLMAVSDFFTGSDNKFVSTSSALPDFYPVAIAVGNGTDIASVYTHTYDKYSTGSDINILHQFTKFDWHPYIFDVDNNGYIDAWAGDVNWFTTLDINVLRAMHDSAILKEFTIVR